jgi:hypothetical protein
VLYRNVNEFTEIKGRLAAEEEILKDFGRILNYCRIGFQKAVHNKRSAVALCEQKEIQPL